MKTTFNLLFFCAFAFGLGLSAVHGQMIASGLTGVVIDVDGSPVPDALVTVVHTPTNTTFAARSGPNGRFSTRGMPVGGPYTITATVAGYKIQPVSGVETRLGEDVAVTLVGSSDIVTLERYIATASRSGLDSNSTGTGSVLSSRNIALQPTATRSFADLIKTNPFVTIRAGQQVTALGMNNRYNSITLDGARLNDQFGLNLNGLFSLKNPFSLDAIEQFSISLVPYDVAQSGFAGAAINAVSKSGTNEFHGSTYVIYTSDKWQGKDISGTNIGKRPVSFIERTQGFTLGGPIVKDRLFFFANYEKFANPSGGLATGGFNPSGEFLSWVDNQISALPGAPDLGAWGGNFAALDTEIKRLLKLDWNVTDDHRLTVRYSDTKGSKPFFNSFNPGTSFSASIAVPGAPPNFPNGITSLSSSFYDLSVIEKVWAAQLFSNWTPDLKTQLSFSKNDSSSLRTTPVNFPEIRIFNVPGTANTAAATPIATGNALSFGTEMSSMGNGVISNGLSYSGIADYTWKDFAFRLGFDREETDFENLFRNGSYGVFAYNYSPTLDLATAQPLGFARGVAQAGFPGTDVSTLEQTGFFAQAKWEPSRRFNVTFGLRHDVLGSPIAPPYNAAFSTAFAPLYPGIRNDGSIDGSSRLAPRLGFNYALDSERMTQVRGGLGVFLGRNPWVWVSNSYSNAGFGRFTISAPNATTPTPPTLAQYLQGGFSNSDPGYTFDPANPLGTTNLTPASGTVPINLVEPGLNLPTNLRGNLAVDRQLPALDAVFTVEYIHNEAVEAMFYDNLNLKVLNGDAQNRPTAASRGADGRLRFSGSAVAGYGNVLRLRNVRAGKSDYVAFMLDRPLKDGWAYSLAYTRGRATEAQPVGAFTAGSNWGFNHVFNQGSVEVSRSDYDIRNRVQASFSKEFNYLGRLKTVVSLYYEGRSGQPYSYVYAGDLNGDGRFSNDLVAVPVDASDARFDFSGMTASERDAYFNFIQRSGLGKYAGGFAPRNAFTTSWQNRLDLVFTQEVRTVGRIHLECFAHFINLGSWLSKDLFNYIEEINTVTTNNNQGRVLGNASFTSDGRLRPVLTSVGGSTVDANGNIHFAPSSQILPNNADSKWRVQAGVRLKF